jgi:hypothetical protein
VSIIKNKVYPWGANYMEHFQPQGWTQPCLQWVEISALSVIQNSIKIKRDYMTKYSTQGWVQLRDWNFNPTSASTILSCNRFNPGLKLSWFIWACVVVTIYYKKTKWGLFYFRESLPRTYSIAFQPRGWNRPCNRKKIQPG